NPLTTLALALALTSCGVKNAGDGEIIEGDLISTRPQSKDSFIAIVRLESPALLKTASVVDGRPVIDAAARQALLEEQKEMEEKLLALDPRVRILNRYRLVLNGLAVLAPKELEEKLKGLTGLSYVERVSVFARAEVTPSIKE